ncbi:MAG: radical SAM protein [Chloroflexi bacterium]|nr:radical SAM protein [Chloroflexota bacterium]
MAVQAKEAPSKNEGKLGLRIFDRGKSFVHRAKARMFEYAFTEALTLLAHSSEKNYVHLAKAFRLQAKDRTSRMVADWVERYLSPGNPGSAYLKRILTSIDPNVRKSFIAGFIASLVFHDMTVMHKLPNGRVAPSPACVLISPTMRCNLKCFGCYAGNYHKKDDMPQEVLERVLGEARDLGTRFFIILGGEPLMYPGLLDVCKKFGDCVFQIYTSGHLLTPEMAHQIVKIGNIAPQVSIEGFKEETEARRGAGGFDRAVRAMDLLREARALFAFSVTVTQRNIDVVTSDEFIDFMIEKGAHYGWYFSYCPVGRNPDLSLMPTPQQRNQLRIAVNRIRVTKPILVGDFWNDGALSEGCLSGGRRYVHINNKGDVEPCVFVHFATDNINNVSLKEALASDFFVAYRKASPFGTNLLRPCPIIDRPHVLRGLVKKFGARPTHEGAETIVDDLADDMDRYAAGLREIYDPIWAEEYQWAADLHTDEKYRTPR